MRYDPSADQYILNWDTSPKEIATGSYNVRAAMGEGEKCASAIGSAFRHRASSVDEAVKFVAKPSADQGHRSQFYDPVPLPRAQSRGFNVKNNKTVWASSLGFHLREER